MSAAVPYVIGQWVRGARFYGRQAEIAALVGSSRRALWIGGLRRIGKTSLLRQLELCAGAGGAPRLAVFWDLQAADTAEELGRGFADALLEAAELLAGHDIAVAGVEDSDLVACGRRLLAALARRGVELLLLCDEADELAGLGGDARERVGELWRAVLAGGGRVVLASSLRLCDRVAEAEDVAPLVDGFAPPLYLGALTDQEACSLLRQSQLPADARPRLDAAAEEVIRDQCGNHPMLLQMVGKRCHELGDARQAVREVAAERTLDHLFAVDYALLAAGEQELLRALAVEGHGTVPADAEVRRLVVLGLVRRCGEGRLAIANRFFASWLRRARPV